MRAIDPELRKILEKFSHLPFLVTEDGTKHARVRNTQSGDWLPVAGSSGDRRSARNFEAGLRRLAKTGHGFIFCKTGRLPSIH